MSTKSHLSEALQEQIREQGIPKKDIEAQLERFRKGFPDLEIDRPATIGDGILQIPEDEEFRLADRFSQAQKEGRIMKFVPASGAASRMFKSLQTILNSSETLTAEFFESHSDDEDAAFTRTFLDHLETFAFFEDLVDVLHRDGMDPRELIQKQDFRTLLTYVLDDKGLGLASLPKALIPFHRYDDHRRAPLEEHLAEAIAYTQAQNGSIRIHFTISPEHKKAFDERLAAVRSRFETGGISFHVETSFQKPETDTIAADPENQPFLDDDGKAVFRPGGHGALLVNLEELRGDVVFIKNIDNVVPDRLKETTYRYKKLIGGYLLSLQDTISFYLKELDREGSGSQLIDEIVEFVRKDLHVDPPADLKPALKDMANDLDRDVRESKTSEMKMRKTESDGTGSEKAGSDRMDPDETGSGGTSSADSSKTDSSKTDSNERDSNEKDFNVKDFNKRNSNEADSEKAQEYRRKLISWLFDRLNRPIRVCGMVKNEGEPGGGPFVVRHGDGSASLQIVESAQVNMDDPSQKKIFDSSTHFNPVDLACSLRDYQGRPFDLTSFRDPETGFISGKSYQGRELKALELPGLWNGSMAHWNTVFVEVPAVTFNPVKTVNDLLRDEHRNE